MSTWFEHSGGATNAEYAFADIRSFNRSLVRAYCAMQRAQTCVQVYLDWSFFGKIPDLRHTVWCCRVSDNTPPRIACEDRELTLRILRPWVMGVDPAKHKGSWLTRRLVYSFLVGLRNELVIDDTFVCKCPLGIKCPGRKANEAHQLVRDIEMEKRKDKKDYVVYEPSDAEMAND